MQAVILAGGEGTRLRPITSNLPKPVIPVFDKPVMEHIIEFLKRHGITEIAVALGYSPQSIIDYFSDGSKWGVAITYFEEYKKLGTAGCVKNCEQILGDEFVVISGDCITDIDLSNAINVHHEKNADATIILTSQKNPTEYGVVDVDNSGLITQFHEKPDWSEVFSDTINTGIYILKKSVLNNINYDEDIDFSRDVFPEMLANKAKLYGCKANGYWCDIGNCESYKNVHKDLMMHYIAPSAQISASAKIGTPAYIGENAKIGENAEISAFSFVGSNSEIFKSAKINNSVINKGCKIYKNAEVNNSIVCDYSNIGAYSKLNSTVVGRDTFIGEECALLPDTKIWPNKIIENHSVIDQNIVWGKSFSHDLFEDLSITGEINMEVTPEFCAKLGASFGSTLRSNAQIAIARGIDSPAVGMLKSAFISGAISSGVNVFDFGVCTLPVARSASQFYELDGCIYINYIPDRYPLNANIYILEKNGGYFTRNSQRRLEQIFARSDFARSHPDKIGKVAKVKNFTNFYIKRAVNENKVKGIDVSVLSNSLESIDNASIVLDKIGATVYSVYNANMITAFIDDNGETVYLHDENGRRISDEQYLYLVAEMVVAFAGRTPKFVSPSYAPAALANITHLIPTKADVALIQEALLNNELDYQFRLMFDAPFALAEVCKFMHSSGKKLFEIINEMPQMFFTRRTLKLDESKKAELIRKLNEFKRENTGKGSIVVIPHRTKSSVQIIAEGVSAEVADELCADIINKLR